MFLDVALDIWDLVCNLFIIIILILCHVPHLLYPH